MHEINHILLCNGVTTACCLRGLVAVDCFRCSGGRSVLKRSASLDSFSVALFCLLSRFAWSSSSFCFSFSIYGKTAEHIWKSPIGWCGSGFPNGALVHIWKLGSCGLQYSLQLVLAIRQNLQSGPNAGLTTSRRDVFLTAANFHKLFFTSCNALKLALSNRLIASQIKVVYISVYCVYKYRMHIYLYF